jgi:hypothetical protein
MIDDYFIDQTGEGIQIAARLLRRGDAGLEIRQSDILLPHAGVGRSDTLKPLRAAAFAGVESINTELDEL